MPLTDLGYERPTYDDILEAQIDRAKVLFGDDIDTNENTPLGKYIRLNVTDLADVYEILENIYYARFPNTARGISLDRLCPFAGISRNSATYAKHTVKFTGVAGEYVPEAFEVSAGDIIFHTYDSVLIGEDGTATAIVECETAGTAGNVTVGSIDTIVNPDTNVESVTHVSVYELAKDIETDTELRKRFNLTISGAGSTTKDAISGAISRVPLVESVSVIENITEHNFACYVLAPTTQDTLIAEAIFDKKPLGIQSVGDVDVDIVDESGVTHTVSFYRTKEYEVRGKYKIYVNSYFPSDGYEQIKNNMINYINSLKNGEDVYSNAVASCAFKTSGVVDVDGYIYSNRDYYYTEIYEDEVAKATAEKFYVSIYDESSNYIGGDPEGGDTE